MIDQIRVRLHATCEIRVPLDTEIDLAEFTEWYEESGAVFSPDDIDADSIVEFIKASPDDEFEMNAQFPNPDAYSHEILSFSIDEAEVLLAGKGADA